MIVIFCREGEQQAMMDLVLLSRCRHIVSSVHSTFSYAAHALAGITPWVVSSASSKVRIGHGLLLVISSDYL
jgi:hypothetical protein